MILVRVQQGVEQQEHHKLHQVSGPDRNQHAEPAASRVLAGRHGPPASASSARELDREPDGVRRLRALIRPVLDRTAGRGQLLDEQQHAQKQQPDKKRRQHFHQVTARQTHQQAQSHREPQSGAHQCQHSNRCELASGQAAWQRAQLHGRQAQGIAH